MEGFKKSSYASHGFSKIELFVILLAIVFVVMIAYPKVLKVFSKIKVNSAIDSVYSYKDSVYNYYVSQLIVNSDFKLDGYYTISDGKLVDENAMHNILMSGNVPSTGYLDYENNVLIDGCIVVDGYAVTVENGDVVSAVKGTCDFDLEDNFIQEVDMVLGM